jgi:proteasome assembly chaperone (PAC2) family protein
MYMDEVTFHREPPSPLPTLVMALGGWIDAGEAATGALRALVRQLKAEPLAEIDPEDFVDFTQLRPVVRLTAEGERILRWPRSAFWLWQPPAGHAGLLLLRGFEPQRRWRTYATLLLDVAARCGVQRIVSLGAVLEAVPHTRPPQVTGTSTDPTWQAWLERRGMVRHGRRYEGPTGLATVVAEAARQRGLAHLTLRGPTPHYLGNTVNPAVCRALLTTLADLLDLALDVAPFEAAVRAFHRQCDHAIARDAEIQAYVRQLEQAYDAPGATTPRPGSEDDGNPAQLIHDLEEFLRQERDRGAE